MRRNDLKKQRQKQEIEDLIFSSVKIRCEECNSFMDREINEVLEILSFICSNKICGREVIHAATTTLE